MTDSMIERVARAIYDKYYDPGVILMDGYEMTPKRPWGEVDERLRRNLRLFSRAAFDAMSVPSETMLDAAIEASNLEPAVEIGGGRTGRRISVSTEEAANIWKAMIDAALAETTI